MMQQIKKAFFFVAWVDLGKYRKALFQVGVLMTYTNCPAENWSRPVITSCCADQACLQGPLRASLQSRLYKVWFLAYTFLQGAAVQLSIYLTKCSFMLLC